MVQRIGQSEGGGRPRGLPRGSSNGRGWELPDSGVSRRAQLEVELLNLFNFTIPVF